MSDKPKLLFPKEVLDRLLGWLLCWPEVSPEARAVCERLFADADRDAWREDAETEFRCLAVLKAARLRRTLDDRHLLEARIREDMASGDGTGLADSALAAAAGAAGELDAAAVEELEGMLGRRKAWCALQRLERPMRRMLECVASHDYDDLGKFLAGAKTVFQRGSLAVRDVEDGGGDARMDFVLGENSRRVFDEVGRELRLNSNMVRTGLAMHNDQLGGGWQAGRVYVYVGRTGGGKSLFLMNCMRWFRLFNKTLEPSRPGAAPCALYLSLENDMYETAERLWDAFVPPSARGGRLFQDLTGAEHDEWLERADAHGGGPPHLLFRYRPNKSQNTADVEAMLSEIQSGGHDVRMLVLDYLKRVLPVNSYGDLRQDLGEVVNELSSIAKHWRIPVVTVMQMNIEGIELLETAARKESLDPLLGAGTKVVGESRLIVENADFVFCIDSPMSPSDPGGRVFTANRIKVRGRTQAGSRPHIVYPYLEEGSFLLDEDADDPVPRGRDSMGDGLADYGFRGPENVAAGAAPPPEDGDGPMPF